MSLLRDVFPSSMDPDSLSVSLRPLSVSTAASARAVATAALGDWPYAESLLTSLDGALAHEGNEYRAIVASRADAVVGLIVFGETAGALGAGRIHLLAVDAHARRRGIGARLVTAACDELTTRGARFAMLELPGAPAFASVRRLAQRLGFREEGRVDDFLREGTPLILLRRDLAPNRSDAAS